ncbi:MAG: MBL fold metallo-hydrolase [Phycisphaerales bacterium]|nr:MAG: MBL fold metallo-hydrolase [Phycisphaerales bacterium]
MKINRLVLGAYQTNSYVLRASEAAAACLIVDTGLEAGDLVDFLGEHELDPVGLILTHGHADHIGGIDALRENFADMKVCIHRIDAPMLSEAERNLSALAGAPFTTTAADLLLEEGDKVHEAEIWLQVLHTPGHTPGGICLYSKDEGIVFVGDTLFADSVGRTDFPGGSMAQLVESIRQKLLVLPDETVVYPGHGPATTLGQERAHNQFLR